MLGSRLRVFSRDSVKLFKHVAVKGPMSRLMSDSLGHSLEGRDSVEKASPNSLGAIACLRLLYSFKKGPMSYIRAKWSEWAHCKRNCLRTGPLIQKDYSDLSLTLPIFRQFMVDIGTSYTLDNQPYPLIPPLEIAVES